MCSLPAPSPLPTIQTLKVWNLETGDEPHTLEGHSRSVTAVAVTPDGQRAVSASWDNTLKVWDLRRFFKGPPIRERLTGSLNTVMPLGDCKRAVSGPNDHASRVYQASGEHGKNRNCQLKWP